MYIVIAILIFGILIIAHEAGHFTAAKLVGVKVNEFAVGMGPKLFSKQVGETEYSLRALPVGGFCAMEGEDEKSDDLRAFTNQNGWKKFVILIAGSLMNFLIGLVILIVIFAPAQSFITPVISEFMDGFPYESEAGLLPGDRILSIDGEKVYTYSDVSVLFARSNGETMNLVIQRDGETIERNNFPLVLREYVLDGETQMKYGIIFTVEPATIPMRLHESWYSAVDFVRMVRLGLSDLISGAASFRDLSGPVGVVGYISEVGSQSADTASAITNVLYFSALIAVNLAVMNMLPLPALDGGRIFFLFVNGLYALIFRRKLDPKYEGYVHAAGLICLLALMAAVTFSDIAKLVTGT